MAKKNSAITAAAKPRPKRSRTCGGSMRSVPKLRRAPLALTVRMKIMSYAEDLAKDRDKYLLQRNQLLAVLEEVLTTRSQKARAKAGILMRRIGRSDPIANAID